ncbi:TPA: BspA family leucine-rich repeat surface protein, partial [Campylobacter coli]|nr:BspA family leucine-rich repeat surface protein [Campylobacter coli]
FWGCKNFNQPLGRWNVSNVKNMVGMFWGCESFNQPLEKWNTSRVKYTDDMFENCPIDNSNKPEALQELSI